MIFPSTNHVRPTWTRRRSRFAASIGISVALMTPAACSDTDSVGTVVGSNLTESIDGDATAVNLLPRALDSYQGRLFEESEKRLAECMEDANFDYEPGDPFAYGYQQVPNEVYDMETNDFVTTYAWGYSTLLYLPHFINPDEDANSKERASLSVADQGRWDETLTQCTQDLEVSAVDDTAEFVFLRSAQQVGLGIYNEDPRVAAEYERWSTCMAEAGVEGIDSPLDVEVEMQTAMINLQNEVGGTTSVTAEDLTALPEYDAIVSREHEIASASLTCDFPPPLLQRNEVLTPILLESLKEGYAQYEAAQ